MKNYYELVGLNPKAAQKVINATVEKIREEHRLKLSDKYASTHKGAYNLSPLQKKKEQDHYRQVIAPALKVLSNPVKREQYDKSLQLQAQEQVRLQGEKQLKRAQEAEQGIHQFYAVIKLDPEKLKHMQPKNAQKIIAQAVEAVREEHRLKMNDKFASTVKGAINLTPQQKRKEQQHYKHNVDPILHILIKPEKRKSWEDNLRNIVAAGYAASKPSSAIEHRVEELKHQADTVVKVQEEEEKETLHHLAAAAKELRQIMEREHQKEVQQQAEQAIRQFYGVVKLDPQKLSNLSPKAAQHQIDKAVTSVRTEHRIKMNDGLASKTLRRPLTTKEKKREVKHYRENVAPILQTLGNSLKRKKWEEELKAAGVDLEFSQAPAKELEREEKIEQVIQQTSMVLALREEEENESLQLLAEDLQTQYAEQETNSQEHLRLLSMQLDEQRRELAKEREREEKQLQASAEQFKESKEIKNLDHGRTAQPMLGRYTGLSREPKRSEREERQFEAGKAKEHFRVAVEQINAMRRLDAARIAEETLRQRKEKEKGIKLNAFITRKMANIVAKVRKQIPGKTGKAIVQEAKAVVSEVHKGIKIAVSSRRPTPIPIQRHRQNFQGLSLPRSQSHPQNGSPQQPASGPSQEQKGLEDRQRDTLNKEINGKLTCLRKISSDLSMYIKPMSKETFKDPLYREKVSRVNEAINIIENLETSAIQSAASSVTFPTSTSTNERRGKIIQDLNTVISDLQHSLLDKKPHKNKEFDNKSTAEIMCMRRGHLAWKDTGLAVLKGIATALAYVFVIPAALTKLITNKSVQSHLFTVRGKTVTADIAADLAPYPNLPKPSGGGKQ